MDPSVKILLTRDTVGIDPLTILPSRNKSVTFMVGDHGPFTEIIPYAEFNAQTVERKIGAVVDTLRATGQIT